LHSRSLGSLKEELEEEQGCKRVGSVDYNEEKEGGTGLFNMVWGGYD